MLRFLRISHLAVIDSLEIEFEPGLNVLTGETGAGKSMLVEAVGLLLGGRASADLVRTGEETAIVEALFDVGEGELLVRREITAQGRSRAFVNGSLTTVGGLKDLSPRLVELHGQNEYQTLRDSSTHLTVLDTFGSLDTLVAPVRSAFTQMRASKDALAQATHTASERQTRRELVEFQLAELDRADLKSAEVDEDARLTAEREVLASAERVERLCAESYSALYESDAAVLAGLAGVWRRLAELALLDPRFEPFLEQREAIKSQLDDLAHFLRQYTDGIDASPARLQYVQERLALIEQLKRKYGPTLADVVGKRDELRRGLSDMDESGERTVQIERDYGAARTHYLEGAGELAGVRRSLAVEFARQLEAQLAELAMESTRLEVRFTSDSSEAYWTADGTDQAELFVSANPGEELRSLARIASGGELSRIMLAIKTLTTTMHHGLGGGTAGDRTIVRSSGEAPGLVFDEVDAGIGGHVAEVVGQKLRTLGSTFQVLCITHLPQIAACADTHYRIEKLIDRGRTTTRVTRLDEDARVEELGRMLSGSGITEGMRASAREMLQSRRQRPATSEAGSKGESERAKAKARRRT